MLVCHTFRWTADSCRSYNSADSRFLYVLNFGRQPIPWTADLWMSYNSVDNRFLFVLHFGVQLDSCVLTSKMKAVFLHALSLNALQRHSTKINALQRHNTENSKQIFAEKELRGHSPNPISTFMCLWTIYIFPRLVCLFCYRKICGLILGIYQSLTDTLMWELGLRPSNYFSENT